MTTNQVLNLARQCGKCPVKVSPSDSGFNYPLRDAIIGFADYSEAEKFAEENDMRVHIIVKYKEMLEGDIWINRGCTIDNIDVREFYADHGYNIIDPGDYDDVRDFTSDFAVPRLSDVRNLEEIHQEMEFIDKVWAEYSQMKDGEFIVAEHRILQRLERYSAHTLFNGSVYAIACIPRYY